MEGCVIFLKRKKMYLLLELVILFLVFVQYIINVAMEEKEVGQAVLRPMDTAVQMEDENGISSGSSIADATKEEIQEESTKKDGGKSSNESDDQKSEEHGIQKIRVLLKTTGSKANFHNSVKVVPSKDCILSVTGDNGKKKTLKAGKTYTFKKSSPWLGKGTATLTPKKNGKIKVCSIRRTCGNPSYRGTLEMIKTEEGILLVNELPLEEYLYAVVPSEMPVSYGIESLKVQAVCARCYAYSQLGSSEMKTFYADVDDSTSYQVYNNVAETPDSIRAVELTEGMVPVTADGKMITAYYYSTSCGYTANIADAWELKDDNSTEENKYNYLQGKPQFIKQKEAEKTLDLSNENNFRDFLEKETRQTYDSAFPWYRWKVSVSGKSLEASVQKYLPERLEASPSMVKIEINPAMEEETEEKKQQLLALLENLKSETAETTSILENLDFGTWEDVKVASRSMTGMITCIELTYSRVILYVYGEYNIRCLLAGDGTKICRQDGSIVTGLNLLPSSFFYLRKKGKNYIITGGGYGHGVGMSQNGVKTMAEKGYHWEEILKHYYQEIEIKKVEQDML